MLSSERFAVPKDAEANLRWRLHVLEACSQSREMRAAVRWACKNDILFFINTFVYQYDPTDAEGRVGPFITWGFQERILLDRPETTGKKGLLWCIENKQPVVWEKSREMGATWLFLIAEDWLNLFFEFFQSLNISKSADAVDSKTKNSLFSKVRFINEHLPDWLKGEVVDQRMYIEFKGMRSEMAGEASSARAGVGGRGGFVGVDEAAEIEELNEVAGKLVSTAPFRLFVSTHLGTGNVFYELTQEEAYVVRRMHWTQHPDKNEGLYSFDPNTNKRQFWEYVEATDEIVEIPGPVHKCLMDYEFDDTGNPTGGIHPGIRSPWYDKKVKEMRNDLRMVAMQLDINPTGSVTQFYNPSVIRKLKYDHARPPYYECDLEYDKETGVPVKLVRKAGGKVKIWCELRDGKPPVSRYGAGVDVAQGTGNTPSCLTIANARTGEKVLEYMDSLIEPKAFGCLAVALCRLFCDEDENGALIAWEHCGPGTAFGLMVWDTLGYANVWTNVREHDMKKTRSSNPGWYPDPKSKLQLHIDYRAALMDGKYLNRSAHALDETLNFKHDGKGSVEHTQYVNKNDASVSRENHGDVVIADAISCKMIRGYLQDKVERKEEPETLDVRCFQGRVNMHAKALREASEIW